MCKMLSSATEPIVNFSFGFHAMSDTFEVCPPCKNTNSGGPSSSLLGFPIFDISQIAILLSCDPVASTLQSNGDQLTEVI